MKNIAAVIFCLITSSALCQPVADSNVVKSLFFAGLQEKLRENYSSAQINFNKIVSIQPENDAVWFELATLAFRQNKIAEAESALKKAISINKENKWYHKMLAEVYKRSNNMPALISTFNELIRLEPDNEDYYYDRANAWNIAGNSTEANNSYNILENKFGSSPELTQARKRINMSGASTPSDMEKLLETEPTDLKGYLYLSDMLMNKKKVTEALALLQKAKLAMPDSYQLDVTLADIYRIRNDQIKSVQSLSTAFKNPAMPVDDKVRIVEAALPFLKDKSIYLDLARELAELHPDNPKALMVYGDVLYFKGKLLEAKTQYLSVIKLSKQIYSAWEQLLNIEVSSAQYEAAIQLGEEALTYYPNQATLYYYLAFSQHRSGLTKQAESNIRSALMLDGDNKPLQALVYALQGEMFLDQNKAAQANASFEKAVQTDPTNFLLLNNYAFYLALRDQDLKKAEALIEKAAAGDPSNSSIADTYAFILFKQGKFIAARKWIEKALQNNGALHPVFNEHYGDILFALGEKEGAVEQWKKSQQGGNDSPKLIRKINEQKYIK